VKSPTPLRLLAASLLLPSVTAFAQNVQQAGGADRVKRAMTIDDYSRWRTIEGAQISGDGKWVAYVLRNTNVPQADSKPVLYIRRLENNQDVTIADATNPTFSPDSKWITYQVEPPPPRAGRGRGAGTPTDSSAATDTTGGRGRAGATPPPARRTELRELATGSVQSWQDVASSTFSPTSSHLLLRRRPAGPTPGAGAAGAGAPAPAGPPGGGAGSGVPRGTDALLHDLANSRSQFLGSIGDASFNRKGELLAYTVEATVRDGNGLFVIDLAGGRTHVLDNDAKNYARLTWNDEGTAVAVLKGREVPRMRERDNELIVFPNVRQAFEARGEPTPVALTTAAQGFPKGFMISDRAPLSWSDDNKRIFLGIIPQTSAPDTARRRSADSVADVDVWRTQDERIQSLQMIQADGDRNFTFRQAFDVAAAKYITLTDSAMRTVEIAPDGRWAVGRDTKGYISDIQRLRADFYRINTLTGERTLMFKNHQTAATAGISPDGKHFLYWKDNRHHDWDLDANTTKPIGPNAPSFVNTDYDYPGPKPSYGVGGFTKDGRSIVVYGKYDVWALPVDGSPATNLTNGMGNSREIVFRYVRSEPSDPMSPRNQRDGRWIDLSKPITLSAYGQWTKKSGFYRLEDGKLTELVYDDAAYSDPVRAAKADRFLLTRQTFSEYPDLRVSGPTFTDAKKISDANPQQAEFLWGRRVLFDYKDRDGHKLQGILAIPDDYKPGEKRPMIVTFYEKNSQNMHRYSSPSFVTGMGQLPMEAVTKGYLAMMPDVYYHTGSSHSDQLDAVEAATKKVIEMGYVDPKKIGVHGHSYGGEGAAFIGVRSKMFAAVGMGAGVTDLYADFSQPWGWAYQVNSGSGANAFDYYLFGQGRWGFSPWDKPEVFRYESAITHAPNANQPILIMHGTADPTVSFSEGLNFYEALRYNKKNAVLLAYPNEGHGLRGLANRKDLTIRYFQFFDHYLKGAPAPKWMTDGVPFLVKDTVKEPK
jgi:dipeptidyl aminopeptidase/acylaminoacyl peptidase